MASVGVLRQRPQPEPLRRHTSCLRDRASGFTLVELIVVIFVVGLLLSFLFPALVQFKYKNARIGCVSRLKNIGLGFRIFATDHQGQFPMQLPSAETGMTGFVHDESVLGYFSSISNMISTPIILVCPADRNRKPAPNFASLASVNVSYFVGLDASERLPKTMLAGDRNLTLGGGPVRPGLRSFPTNAPVGWSRELHNRQGNVAVGDGSVQQLNEVRLRIPRTGCLVRPRYSGSSFPVGLGGAHSTSRSRWRRRCKSMRK